MTNISLCQQCHYNNLDNFSNLLIILTASVAAPQIIPDSLDPPPNSEILSTHTIWRMQFDAQVRTNNVHHTLYVMQD